MGESELVLDRLQVEDVLRLIGAAGKPATEATRLSIRELAPAAAQDWRASLRDAGVNVDAPVSSPASFPDAAIESSPPTAEIPHDMAFKKGIVVTPNEAELLPSAIEKLRSLDEIAEKVRKCTRCPLYATATNPVPGEGDPKAELVCVGEAPGAKEDETGRPFVGQAGQLLTKILAAIDLTREQVFICNVLKHRPPGNRNPLPEEVEACSPYLIRQLELIKPKVIVAFGTFAAQMLLQTKTPLGQLRGLVHRYHGIPLIVTYHPAALLRNPAWKRPTWEDVKLARRILDSASGS
jgi:uracil-DNA glycosylase family 4